MITVMMPTFKRNNFLIDADHPTLNLINDRVIDRLILIWHNIGEEVPNDVIKALENKCGKKFKIVYPEKNSLNNRFYNYPEIKTDCIVSIDDDYTPTKESLYCMFEKWNKSKNTLVGCVPRYFDADTTPSIYTGDAAHFKSKIPYNFLLTGYAMFHKKYLDLYWENSAATDLVDINTNGEDIYFNFMHYKHCQEKRVYVHHDKKVKTWKMDPKGISSQSGHLKKRIQMFNLLKKANYDTPRYDNFRFDIS